MEMFSAFGCYIYTIIYSLITFTILQNHFWPNLNGVVIPTESLHEVINSQLYTCLNLGKYNFYFVFFHSYSLFLFMLVFSFNCLQKYASDTIFFCCFFQKTNASGHKILVIFSAYSLFNPLPHRLIETPFNAFAHRVDPDQAARAKAA